MTTIETFDWTTDTWKVLDAYFKQPKILTQHQLNSFEELIRKSIPQFIERNNPIVIGSNYMERYDAFQIELTIRFGQTYMSKPIIQENNGQIKLLYPWEARIRGLTYDSQMFVDVTFDLTIRNKDNGETLSSTTNIEKKIPLVKIPVMLHSTYCHLHNKTAPELVKMGECKYDLGGYFIISGSEKVLISQERMAENKVYVFPVSKSSTKPYIFTAEIKSSIDQRYYPIKINAVHLTKQPSSREIKKALDEGRPIPKSTLVVYLPYFKKVIPLFTVFRALGIVSEKEIYQMILYDLEQIEPRYLNFLQSSVLEARQLGTIDQETALSEMVKYLNLYNNKDFQKQTPEQKKQLVKNILLRDFLPHIGVNQRRKAIFLGYMTRRLMDAYFGIRPLDDRDHYANKRVDLSGSMIIQIFRTHFLKLIKDLKSNLLSEIADIINDQELRIARVIRKTIHGCSITSKIKYAMATGNWNTQKGLPQSSKMGLSQVLSRLSYISALSHVRRINSPLDSSGSKIVPPRRLHGTNFGMCCPNETPEGKQVGIVKNLAMQCHVTTETSSSAVLTALQELGMQAIESIQPQQMYTGTLIFVNGNLVGLVSQQDSKTMYDNLRILKRHGIIVPYVSIAWNIEFREMLIQTDGGRYMRPLYIIENDQLLIEQRLKQDPQLAQALYNGTLNWNDLLRSPDIPQAGLVPTLSNGAVIEYLDTAELDNSMVAMTPQDLIQNRNPDNFSYLHYSHLEIHPSMMLGIVATMIPFSDHNQAPRNCYQSSMGKQAIGYYVTNYNQRMDTMAHIMVYAQKPLVLSRTMKYMFMDRLPHGAQTMVLYAVLGGYNQEDSVYINKSAVERGLFNTLFFRTYDASEQPARSKYSISELLMKPIPDKTLGLRRTSYEALQEDGRPKLNHPIEGGQAIIGKVIYNEKNVEYPYRDSSVFTRPYENGMVDKVVPDDSNPDLLALNNDGHQFIKARVSSLRQPEIGDKFASRHAQKGSTGLLVTQADMPFTAHGEVPDVIMNPHSIPSRMTVGMLMETLLGKVAVTHGSLQDCTTFVKRDVKQYAEILARYGFEPHGNEIMYNGRTGQQFQVQCFYGPTYYQRLKHMVRDKMHARHSGPVQLLTRQPAEGRSRDGGLRVGEMERDCLTAHGVSAFLKEKMVDSSDLFRIHVSKQSGLMVTSNIKQDLYMLGDRHLKNDQVSEVQLPYAMKLFLHELMSMGIDVRLNT